MAYNIKTLELDSITLPCVSSSVSIYTNWHCDTKSMLIYEKNHNMKKNCYKKDSCMYNYEADGDIKNLMSMVRRYRPKQVCYSAFKKRSG